MKSLSETNGFTIIELLIATSIFTIILIITTTTIIGISKTYIKGSVEGQTQQTASDILSDISENIQLNSYNSINLSGLTTTASSPDKFDFCIGDDVYAFVIDKYLGNSDTSTENNWVLARYPEPVSSQCPSDSSLGVPPAGAEELAIPNERLGQLDVTENTITSGGVSEDAYSISLEVGYAADDNSLISDTTAYGSPYYNWTSVPANGLAYKYPYVCQSGNDSSFCAVSSLTTTVVSRINN